MGRMQLLKGTGPLFAVQIVLYLLGALVWWFIPTQALMGLGSVDPSHIESFREARLLGIGITQNIGPMAFGLVVFSSIALMRREASFQRAMAQGLWVWLFVWISVFWFNVTGHFFQIATRFEPASFAVGVPLMLIFLWLTPVAIFRGQAPQGHEVVHAEPRSRWQGWGWAAQGVYFMAIGLFFLFLPEKASFALIAQEFWPSAECWQAFQELQGKGDLLTGCAGAAELHPAGTHAYFPLSYEVDQVRISASYFLAMGFFSLRTNWLSDPQARRSMVRSFLLWQAPLLLTLLAGYTPWFFSSVLPVHMVVLALLVLWHGITMLWLAPQPHAEP